MKDYPEKESSPSKSKHVFVTNCLALITVPKSKTKAIHCVLDAAVPPTHKMKT